MPLTLTINGQPREFAELAPDASLAQLVAAMELKGDRIAIELNREIAQRATWEQTRLHPGDRLEIVHFVGGGCQALRGTAICRRTYRRVERLAGSPVGRRAGG